MYESSSFASRKFAPYSLQMSCCIFTPKSPIGTSEIQLAEGWSHDKLLPWCLNHNGFDFGCVDFERQSNVKHQLTFLTPPCSSNAPPVPPPAERQPPPSSGAASRAPSCAVRPHGHLPRAPEKGAFQIRFTNIGIAQEKLLPRRRVLALPGRRSRSLKVRLRNI